MFERLFRKKKEVPLEYFVALKLDESTISASVFTAIDGKTTTYGKSYEEFSGDWDSCINATDQAVSQAAGDIDLSSIKKVVFGFPPYYLENDKISKTVLPQLKKLTGELELMPAGFVEVCEAVNFLLEKRDGGPQTNILVGISRNHLVTSLFKGGKLLKQTVSEATDRVVDTVDSVLGTYSDIDIFPTKIILYGSIPLENIHSQFVNYSWQKNPKFLHYPKVEILDNDFCLEAVVEASSHELSFVDKSQSDVLQNEQPAIISEGHQVTHVTPQDLGFTTQPTMNIDKQVPLSQVPISKGEENKKGIRLPSISFSLPKSARRFPNFSGMNVKTRFALLGTVAAFLLLGSGYFVASYTLSRATLTLVVDPKVMGSQKEIGINPDLLTPSQDSNEIPGKLIETEVSGSRTIATTGTKLVGDPAKGTVTVYNKTTSERTFEKGITLTSGNLIFTTDDEVTVPAASETADGLTYGKSTISVTASKIGADGNLAAGTEFTVQDFSNTSYTARNEEALAGGTSREVSVVSASDQESLITQLHDELKNQSVSDLNAKLTSGEHLLEESLTGSVTSRKFSNEVNQETKELTLTLSESFKGLIYKDEDFTRLMEKSLLANIPQGYEFMPSETVLGVSDAVIDKDTNKVRFTADFKARLFPKVNTDKIKSDIKGISLSKLESYMKTVQYVAGYQVNIESPLSLFNSQVPPRTENIEIKIESR